MARSKHKKPSQEDVSGEEFAKNMNRKGSTLRGFKAVFPWKKRRHTTQK